MEVPLCELVSPVQINCTCLKLTCLANYSFVDRDMYMRYRGGGIGHFPTRVDEPEPDPNSASLREQEEGEDYGEGATTEVGDPGNEPEEDDEDEDEDNVDDEDSPEPEDGEGEESDDDEEEILDIEVDGIQLRSDLIEDLGFAEL